MDEIEILTQIKASVVEGNIDRVKELCQMSLNMKIPAYQVVHGGLAEGMKIVGERFAKGESFVTNLIISGEAMKEGLKVLSNELKASKVDFAGRVIIGSVSGDVHDLGKSIVVSLLIAAGFEVYDLGVDVPAEKFVDKAKELEPDIVAASAYMTTTMPQLKELGDALKVNGQKRAKYLVGGSPVTNDYAKKIGADGYASDAVEAVKVAQDLKKGC